jgi:ketosteroid isomerase-like protein
MLELSAITLTHCLNPAPLITSRSHQRSCALDTSMKKLTLLLCAVVVFANFACAQSNKEEQALRDLDKAWSQAANSKDLDRTVSYYAEDGSVLPFGAPIATGKDAIRQVWQHLMSAPGFALNFSPSKIDVSKSGDMAYEIGTFELKMNDEKGQPGTTTGKYVVAWKKSPKHEWKVQADIFNTDK